MSSWFFFNKQHKCLPTRRASVFSCRTALGLSFYNLLSGACSSGLPESTKKSLCTASSETVSYSRNDDMNPQVLSGSCNPVPVDLLALDVISFRVGAGGTGREDVAACYRSLNESPLGVATLVVMSCRMMLGNYPRPANITKHPVATQSAVDLWVVPGAALILTICVQEPADDA